MVLFGFGEVGAGDLGGSVKKSGVVPELCGVGSADFRIMVNQGCQQSGKSVNSKDHLMSKDGSTRKKERG